MLQKVYFENRIIHTLDISNIKVNDRIMENEQAKMDKILSCLRMCKN